MYTIEKTDYGLHVVMGGVYAEQEIRQYIIEKEKILATIEGPYSLLIDLRTAMPPSPEDAKLLAGSQRRLREGNLQRTAIVVASPVLTVSAKQVGFLSGADDSTRIILVSRMPHWKEAALGWILEGIEPADCPELNESVKRSV